MSVDNGNSTYSSYQDDQGSEAMAYAATSTAPLLEGSHESEMELSPSVSSSMSQPMMPVSMFGSPRSPLQYLADKIQPGSIKGSIFTLITATVGAGMLALPYAFSLLGVVLGNLMLALCVLSTFFSFTLLLDSSLACGKKSYTYVMLSII